MLQLQVQTQGNEGTSWQVYIHMPSFDPKVGTHQRGIEGVLKTPALWPPQELRAPSAVPPDAALNPVEPMIAIGTGSVLSLKSQPLLRVQLALVVDSCGPNYPDHWGGNQ